MPLLRLVRHPEGNKQLQDKVIFIDGLPEKLIQVNPASGLWSYDNPKNIPIDVKMKFNIFDIEQIPEQERTFKKDYTRTIYMADGRETKEEGTVEYVISSMYDLKKLSPEVYDKYVKGKNFALTIDFQTSNGETIWQQIERILNLDTPRDIPIPKPAVVAEPGNLRSSWVLSANDVPTAHVNREPVVRAIPAVSAVVDEPVKYGRGRPKKDEVRIKPEKPPLKDEYRCKECNQIFFKPRALWMHERHHGIKREKLEV